MALQTANFFQIGQQILGIDGKAVAQRGRFGRLDVGVGHHGQVGRILHASGEGG